MHELSIAASIIERAQGVSAEQAGARVLKVGVRLGQLSGVDAQALEFGFGALVTGTPLAGAKLEIDYRRRKLRCLACGVEFEPEEGMTACPACATARTECIAGQELDVTFIELEDPPCA